MNIARILFFMRDALMYLVILAGLGAGIYFIIRKKFAVGVVTLAGFVLLGLDPLRNRLYFTLLASATFRGTAWLIWANACLVGGAGLLGKGAMILALILAVRPQPAPT